MRFEIERLRIEGFKAFVQPQVIDFKELGPGLHFIRGKNKDRLGSNGAGKSTILDALSWCLFGQTVEGLRGPDIRPWKHKAATTVSCQINLDGKHHLVTRSLSPNTLTLNEASAGNDDITKLLRLSLGTFHYTIAMGQDQEMFLDLKPAQKMQTFFAIVPSLNRWTERSMLAGRITVDLRDRLSTRQNELAGIDAKITQVAELIADYQKQAAAWDKDNQARIATQEQAIAGWNKNLAFYQDKKAEADLAYDSAMTEIKALQLEIAKLQEPVADLRRLRTELSRLPKASTCPTCGQSLKKTSLAGHIKELGARVATLEPAEARLRASQQALEGFQRRAEQAESSLSLYNTEIGELSARIATAKSHAEARASETNPHTGQVRDLRRGQAKLRTEREELAATIARLEARIERTHYWVKGFKDLQLYLIEEILQELELVTNSILADLGLEDWTLQYVIEKETKSGTVQRGLAVLIRSPHAPKPVRWECYSGGERQRLRVAASLALSEVLLAHAGVVPSMIALDEPSRNLSDQGMDDVCAYLAERGRALSQQCLLIDHLVRPSSHFTTTIEVVKAANGSSRIVV